jgi:Type I restriction-modification system methyltransferase subunit
MQNCLTNIGPKPVGAVFTPLRWASFAIDRFGIYDAWMSGKTVFDPTMGEGNLLEALVKEAISRGVRTEEIPVQRLYGVEVEKSFLSRFFEKMKREYGIDMPKGNFVQADYFFWASHQKFDVVFGNPPWANFADLPETYKGLLKPKFVEYGLAPDKKDLLLGSSRIDISALVIQKAVAEHLKPQGRAVFFLPLSLLLNDGAHKAFRAYSAKGIPFEVKAIFDFNDAAVFEGVSTRYGVVEMVGGREQRFPVPFHRWESGEWVGHMAKPAFLPNDPLSVFKGQKGGSGPAFDPIYLPVNAVPRQGVNTGGANDCFIFDACAPNGDGLVEVANKKHRAILPQEFVHPLLVGKNFKNDCRDPQKWVFIPFQKDGKPLSPDRIRENEHLSKYLGKHEQTLKNRKGGHAFFLDKKRVLVGNARGGVLQFRAVQSCMGSLWQAHVRAKNFRRHLAGQPVSTGIYTVQQQRSRIGSTEKTDGQTCGSLPPFPKDGRHHELGTTGQNQKNDQI